VKSRIFASKLFFECIVKVFLGYNKLMKILPIGNLVIIACLLGFEGVFVYINNYAADNSIFFLLPHQISGLLLSSVIFFVLLFLFNYTYIWNVNIKISFNKTNKLNLLQYLLIWLFVLSCLIILPLELQSNKLLTINLVLSSPFLLLVFITWFLIVFNKITKFPI